VAKKNLRCITNNNKY